MPIKDAATFAEECVRQGLFLGVNPHYLLAVAMLRSGIKDDVDGSRVGPYRVTQALWDANGSASDLEVVLDSVRYPELATAGCFCIADGSSCAKHTVGSVGSISKCARALSRAMGRQFSRPFHQSPKGSR